jgi:putative sterol carrier protein
MKAGTMPAFIQGMHNVSRDEQRHIGFGVKALAEMFAESEECKAAADEILREVMPYSLAVFTPPGWDLRYTREYGFELEDIFAFGLRSVRAKWRAAGYPMEEMAPGVFPFDYSQSEEEIARRGIILLKAGVLGEPNGRPDSSLEVQQAYFDMVARSADTAVLNGDRVTYQWRFSDADPWHVVVENGSTRAEPGEAADPDVVLKSSWADWIGVTTGELDPRRAMLRRRIKPRGSPRQLWRMQKVFPS